MCLFLGELIGGDLFGAVQVKQLAALFDQCAKRGDAG